MKRLRFKGATFNVFDFIDQNSNTALDNCRDIGKALVVRTGEERDPHFREAAEMVICTMLATLMAERRRRMRHEIVILAPYKVVTS